MGVDRLGDGPPVQDIHVHSGRSAGRQGERCRGGELGAGIVPEPRGTEDLRAQHLDPRVRLAAGLAVTAALGERPQETGHTTAALGTEAGGLEEGDAEVLVEH